MRLLRAIGTLASSQSRYHFHRHHRLNPSLSQRVPLDNLRNLRLRDVHLRLLRNLRLRDVYLRLLRYLSLAMRLLPSRKVHLGRIMHIPGRTRRLHLLCTVRRRLCLPSRRLPGPTITAVTMMIPANGPPIQRRLRRVGRRVR